MRKRKQLSVKTRSAIIVLQNEGYSERAIAKKLAISPKDVYYTLARNRKTESLKDRKRNCRPKVTASRENRFIVTTSKRNRRQRISKVSVSTIKNRLLSVGLRGCVAIRKPSLRLIHKKKRLQWARQHEN